MTNGAIVIARYFIVSVSLVKCHFTSRVWKPSANYNVERNKYLVALSLQSSCYGFIPRARCISYGSPALSPSSPFPLVKSFTHKGAQLILRNKSANHSERNSARKGAFVRQFHN
ncbi:hypothetical protein PUN28_003529 [Cardiocondyla obscurior]|uniref:Secreted protein n=1 Tax=Cardiocondyla obscurior TaxID=286306 RepID=A0AAW2GM34_9HYME